MDDGRDGGGRAAFGAGVAHRRGGWRGLGGGASGGGLRERPVDGDGAAEAVEPLLLVKDIVHLQRVGLAMRRVLEAHAEDVLG